MKKPVRYEHKVVNETLVGGIYDPVKCEAQMLNTLNQLSAEGWEVISASLLENTFFRVLLRREIET